MKCHRDVAGAGFDGMVWYIYRNSQESITRSDLRVEPNTNEHIRSTVNASTVSPINTLARILWNCKRNREIRMKIRNYRILVVIKGQLNYLVWEFDNFECVRQILRQSECQCDDHRTGRRYCVN